MSPRAVFRVELVAALLAASVGGCSSSNGSATQSPQPMGMGVMLPDADIDDAGGVATGLPADAMTPYSPGSPLCKAVTWMGCYPDYPRYPDDPLAPTAQECYLAPDGGAYDPAGGYANAPLACHVERVSGGTEVHPVCTPVGPGTEGMPCGESTDCAPGYECIYNYTCRHYCCAGNCARQDEFCDIQPTASDPTLKVPVCMTVHACGLLDQPSDAGSCLRNQSCQVVRENGATSCVAVGQRQAGDECDTDHCARGLTCVGASGHRRCFTLCHTMAKPSDCPSTRQVCTGGLPLFPVPGIGICE